MTQYIKKLPAVFQTVTEKKFFDATFDQVFSKKDSDYLAGYIGRRDPGAYHPVSDFYLPEPTKNRTWWQLEATAYARNADSSKSNIFFYEDLLEKIEYYGGNTLNQDRLFASEYYSFGPPIDYDMFINYQNYYWIEQGLAVINISDIDITGYPTIDDYIDENIIGQLSYTTPSTATPPNMKFTTGMTLSFTGSINYETPRLIENFGGCIGIKLIEKFSDITAGSIFEFLPWDGTIELANGRTINNLYWDATTWETQTQPGTGDYITIERGALDRNAWSRTNKWFHIDAITSTLSVNGVAFPINSTRALRPIIQFVADIALYNSGTQYRDEIQYGFRDDLNSNPIKLADMQNRQLSTLNSTYGISLSNGSLVSFFNDDTPISANYFPWDLFNWDLPPAAEWDAGVPSSLNRFIFRVDKLADGSVTFAPHTSWGTPVLEGDIVFISEDGPYNAAQKGTTWYFSNDLWQEVDNEKISVNQPPLFVLRDHNGVVLDDPVTYPGSSFAGSKIFSYKVNTETGATVDPVLKFPIIYTSLGQISDIVFQNNLITNRYTYSVSRANIDGYYYYKTSQSPVLYNNWNLYQPCPCGVSNSAAHYEAQIVSSEQTVVNTSIINTIGASSDQTYLLVFVNGVMQLEGYSLAFHVTGLNQLTFNSPLSVGDNIAMYSYEYAAATPPGYETQIATAGQTTVTTIALATSVTSIARIVVSINGIMQVDGLAYTVSGANQLTFNSPLSAGDNIAMYSYYALVPPQYLLQVATSGQTLFPAFTVSSGSSYNVVYVNGVMQMPGSSFAYVTSGSQILFNSPLAANDEVAIFSYNTIEEIDVCGVCEEVSRQRVIDKYVVGYGTEYQFKLSVTPVGYPACPDIVVSVNSAEVKSAGDEVNGYGFTVVNNSIYVDLSAYLTSLFITSQLQPPVVEIQTYTHGDLNPAAIGYSAIPQQLEANPAQLEVGEISASNLTDHFASIIANQDGIVGVSFGGNNNYRDTQKNRSVGTYILQNVSPLLKTMLVSSSEELDFITAARFSQDEYTKFKNKYLQTALQLINQGFNPVQYHNNTIVVSTWLDAILKTVNISKEFSDAFAYSYMVANGSVYSAETVTVPIDGLVTVSDYLDLTSERNSLYVYDTSGIESLLVIGQDYEIVSTNLIIELQLNIANIAPGTAITIALYKDCLPAYIPSTPTKIGAYSTFVPRIELDASYIVPTNVIIGHDGSKTIAYGDYRDQLLLELEKRIYNLLQHKFRHQYFVPLRVESVKSGYFRSTRYTRAEFLDITESYLNKWSSKNRANYRTNEWAKSSIDPAVIPSFVPGVGNVWKLYNYAHATNSLGAPLNLPGNWKGIFQYCYDTYNPDTRPWEMLGFSAQPDWWQFEYGAPVLNLAGQEVWTSVAAGNNFLYADLEYGIIRQGPSALYNPLTLLVEPQKIWARPGLGSVIPVSTTGEIISVMDLFDVVFSGNYTEPFDFFDVDWVYGDGSPVEQAWMSTSGYAFSVQEFLYLMRPAPYGELMWDTNSTDLSPGMISVPTSSNLVRSTVNWQYVQNDVTASDGDLAAWMRPRNSTQQVHAENVSGVIQIRFGYQRWISDRILFLGTDVGDVFGQKIRTLDVNLANKVAGFTNKDTTNTYIESITPGSSTAGLIIPTTNVDVMLHKSPPIDTYSYSGVVIRALADGTFAVYGYDLINSEFRVLDRTNSQLFDVSVGGTPAPYVYFTPGATYAAGDYVRYNGIYYISNVTQTLQKFDASGFDKLVALPVVGGISVSYKPISDTTITKIPYGSVLKTPQLVFDFMIGWGAYLESRGWKFDEVSQDTNLINDWLNSAKQFLFWLNTEWAPDASIQLSPLANKATLEVSRGYPQDVETMSNGVYSVLDKFGIAIPPSGTTTDRDGRVIIVEPADLASGGIYFLQVNATETEHIMIFDNVTNFNDVVYAPLLRARQERLRFNGFRSNGWYGKMEAPGYLIIEDQLVPNFDTIVESMRYFYDPNTTIDNSSLEDLGRHLIGYESKDYFDNLQVSDDVQYLFYRGAIRQKGTVQSFEKLFRTTKVQSDEIIEVHEEWALKLSDFGNTVEQVSTEFILAPEQNTGDVIVAKLNFRPSTIGGVKLINVLNASNRYTKVPAISISPPDASVYDPAIRGDLRQARAYAVLDPNGYISRIDITDSGYGYTLAPRVSIVAQVPDIALGDKLYSVWQGASGNDSVLDNIVNIDIDDTSKWTVRPTDTEYSLEFPVTENTVYPMPNAGYVNFKDVDWSIFSVIQAATTWGSAQFSPTEHETIWVANTFTEDWGVYKLVNIVSSPYLANTWRVKEDNLGDLILLTNAGTTLVPQMWDSVTGKRTDFGNMIVLQEIIDGKVSVDVNYTVAFAPYSTQDFNNPGTYTDPDTLDTYTAYSLQTLDGTPIASTDIGDYEKFTDLLLFKTMRWTVKPSEPLLPTYVGLNDFIWVDNVAGKWAVFNIQADPGFWDIYGWDPLIVDVWGTNYGWDVSGPLYFNPHRVQESLINTSFFENATVYGNRPGTQLSQLPVYDPFKNILPGVAKQNLSYITLRDPARYNVTDDARLYNENITFGTNQVGQLWWDLSLTKYVYYEQPVARDGSETEDDNLVYRRDHWGQLFPGSTVAVYEWVKSPVVPSEYTGSGTPRSLTSYVQIALSDRFAHTTSISYYFWVSGATTTPNVENRTMSSIDVALLLQSPKSQGFVFFAPIQQTPVTNSYMFYNVQEILSYLGNNVQIKYRLSDREDQEHAQWMFFRDGDASSTVSDQYWNKMVDSLCGYTKMLPHSDEWQGANVADYNQWESDSWDTFLWDKETIYGEILPVPDPMLGESEKYGVSYRPRQGMFANLTSARKVFVQSANALLKNISVRDDTTDWDTDVTLSNYWEYTNWYAIGYEDVAPSVVFRTLAEASTALSAGLLFNGDIAQVTNGTPDGRFILYAVTKISTSSPVLSLTEVGVENSAIKLLNTVYTSTNQYNLSVELRMLLNTFRTKVMVDAYKVDQNELFFSMINYVVSEQNTPDWVFKTSYIYIKENSLPMVQTRLYTPDQIDNVIAYINDSKPYHTQIRDYTSGHVTSDIAAGTASDSYKIATTLNFGPSNTGYGTSGNWDASCSDESAPGAWDNYAWDVCYPLTYVIDSKTFTSDILQFIAKENVYTVPLTMFDSSKIGLSALFPYTFNFSSININSPQTFITPHDVVGIQIGSNILLYGQDYYVELNAPGNTYTVYFYNDPGTADIPVAFVWLNGGSFLQFRFNTIRNEVAHGFANDNLVVNTDTKLAVNNIDGIYSAFNDAWDVVDVTITNIVTALNPPPANPLDELNGFDNSLWDQNTLDYMEILGNTLSSKESGNTYFYRNADIKSGILLIDVPAVTAETESNDVITVTAPTDIFAEPAVDVPGVIWINGERIEYKMKIAHYTLPDTWELKLVRRGTQGTMPTMHPAMVAEVDNINTGAENETILKSPVVPTPNKVWVENIMPGTAKTSIWSARDSNGALLSEELPGQFSHVTSVPLGGLWYSTTPEAMYLKQSQGTSLP